MPTARTAEAKHDRSANPAAWSLTLGFGAGMAEALFWTAPTERLKILRQAKAGEGVGGAVGELSVILREQGVRGLYVGAGATAARQASSVAVRFSVLDRLSAADRVAYIRQIQSFQKADGFFEEADAHGKGGGSMWHAAGYVTAVRVVAPPTIMPLLIL